MGEKYFDNNDSGILPTSSLLYIPSFMVLPKFAFMSVARILTFLNRNSPIDSLISIAREYGSGPVAHPASQIWIKRLDIKLGITYFCIKSSVCWSLKKKVKANYVLSPLLSMSQNSFRDFIKAHNIINPASFYGFLRHTKDNTACFILRNSNSTALLHF